jgi:catechol 2,3-dioxygenase-like lactoylglutathione lyase family enzyme
MKRLHVSIAVRDLDKSISFYSALFGVKPTVLKIDYAKWMLEDPHVNFSISSRDKHKGIDHLGIQVEDDVELAMLTQRLARAGQSVYRQNATTCCYAKSNKAWVHDPEGVAWETFHTFGESMTYSGKAADGSKSSTCCDTPSAPRHPVRSTSRAAGETDDR